MSLHEALLYFYEDTEVNRGPLPRYHHHFVLQTTLFSISPFFISVRLGGLMSYLRHSLHWLEGWPESRSPF